MSDHPAVCQAPIVDCWRWQFRQLIIEVFAADVEYHVNGGLDVFRVFTEKRFEPSAYSHPVHGEMVFDCPCCSHTLSAGEWCDYCGLCPDCCCC